MKSDIKALWKQLFKLEVRTERVEEILEKFKDVTYKRFDAVENRFDQMEEQSRKDKDDIMNKFDYLIVGAYQIRELREGFTDHEKRLKRLERH